MNTSLMNTALKVQYEINSKIGLHYPYTLLSV